MLLEFERAYEVLLISALYLQHHKLIRTDSSKHQDIILLSNKCLVFYTFSF